MKKPLNVSGISCFILMYLGFMFMLFGYLIDKGIMTGHSEINLSPEFVFITLGSIFFILGLILLFKEIRSHRIYNQIVENGDYARVKVIKIKHDVSFKINRQSPYTIYVNYNDKDIKSFYIWKQPDFIVGDRIKVLVHSSYPKNFVVETNKKDSLY